MLRSASVTPNAIPTNRVLSLFMGVPHLFGPLPGPFAHPVIGVRAARFAEPGEAFADHRWNDDPAGSVSQTDPRTAMPQLQAKFVEVVEEPRDRCPLLGARHPRCRMRRLTPNREPCIRWLGKRPQRNNLIQPKARNSCSRLACNRFCGCPGLNRARDVLHRHRQWRVRQRYPKYIRQDQLRYSPSRCPRSG